MSGPNCAPKTAFAALVDRDLLIDCGNRAFQQRAEAESKEPTKWFDSLLRYAVSRIANKRGINARQAINQIQGPSHGACIRVQKSSCDEVLTSEFEGHGYARDVALPQDKSN
jgi:hypothetical protein